MTSPQTDRTGTGFGTRIDGRLDQRSSDLAGAVHPWDVMGPEIMGIVGDARYVLIGEASHGTEEFYRERAELTKRLILEKGFTAVAVEADWPDAYRVNEYVRGGQADDSAEQALGGFKRFPQWMWRNTVVVDFVEWLRRHNARDDVPVQTGFYGLDLYSLQASVEAVLDYLDRMDPEAAVRARQRYACFDHFGEDGQSYGYASNAGVIEPCEDEVVAQLLELQHHSAELARKGIEHPVDAEFAAEQNARLVMNAEAYYRSMFQWGASSWNLRDRHMAETLRELTMFLDQRQPEARVVVWAHNSHIGDARATEMGSGGELNLGQLVRERVDDEAVLIGFSTYTGTVTAANDWGDPAERRRVRPGLPGSYESLFHQLAQETGEPRFLLSLRDPALAETLGRRRLQRAIGVIYRPDTERQSHYFRTDLTKQFDAMIHLDETEALTPLERTPTWETGEIPETFPSTL